MAILYALGWIEFEKVTDVKDIVLGALVIYWDFLKAR